MTEIFVKIILSCLALDLLAGYFEPFPSSSVVAIDFLGLIPSMRGLNCDFWLASRQNIFQKDD